MSEAEPKLEMTRLGGYTIVRKLAKGGMAEIYLARSVGPEGFSKLVVLKRILPKYAENQRFVQLFLDEAKLAASLDHPHIVSVYDMGRVDGHYFFTMEYVHGQDTRSILRKASRSKTHPIPIAIAVQIARTMASALHHAHERKRPDGTSRDVVHRDVSPSNILVSYDGAIKLADFGVAKAASSTVRTRTGALKGKVGYMSPEQARGMAIDRRSDIFSLGVVLWELISMRRLFKTDNDLATIQAIINTPPPPLADFRNDCPPELERIARRALEKDPATRYQTAQDLQRDLDELGREHKLDQSSIALSKYMTELFDTELAAWREAQSSGSTVTDFIVAHSSPAHATPVSESDLSLDDPEDIDDDDDEPEEPDDPEDMVALPQLAPRAGVISDEPDDATDFGPPPTMDAAFKIPVRPPTSGPRPLAATVPRTPKPPVLGMPNDTQRDDNPFDTDNAATRLRANPMTGDPAFEMPTRVGDPVFGEEAPTVSAPPDILQKAFAETDETVQASPRYTDPGALPDAAYPTPPPGSLLYKEAPTTPFTKAASTAQYPVPDKKPPPNLPSVPHTSNLGALPPDPSILMAPPTPGMVPRSSGSTAPTIAGQPPMPGTHGQPGMPGSMQSAKPGAGPPGSMQPDSMEPSSMEPGSMQPSSMQPGWMQPGSNQLGSNQLGSMQPGSNQPGSMQPQSIYPMQPGSNQLGSNQLGSNQLGSMEPGSMQPGSNQPSSMQPGWMQPGSNQPGSMQPGMQSDSTQRGMQPGSMPGMQSGSNQPESNQPGSMQPGSMQPGSMQPLSMYPTQDSIPGSMQLGSNQPGSMQPHSMYQGSNQPGSMQPHSMYPMQPGMPGSMQPGAMAHNSTGGMPAYPVMRPNTPAGGIPSMTYPSSQDFDPNLSIDLAPQRRWVMIAGIAVAVTVILIVLIVIFSRGSADEEQLEPEEPTAPMKKAAPPPAPKAALPPKVEPKVVAKAGSGSAKPTSGSAGSAGSAEPKPETAPVVENTPLPKITKPPPTMRRPTKRR